MFDFSLKNDPEKLLEKCGIYKITCTTNDKFYVGCTYSSFRNRLVNHKSSLKRNIHYAFYMQNSCNKYGIETFQIEILEILDKSNRDLIFEREDYWIDFLQPHFNYPPTANSMIFVKSEGDPDKKLHAKNKSGHRNVAVHKDGTFSVKIDGYSVGTFKTLEEAIQGRDSFLLNPVYREPKPPIISGERCVQFHREGWIVEVQQKYVGFYKKLDDAIKARDEFLALPIEEQTAKVFQGSNTGHKNVWYRARTDRYRVVFGGDEVASSCKSLEEALEVREHFLAMGERPPNQKAGSGYKHLTETKAGHWAFNYKRKRIATYHTLEEALLARDTYIKTQNESIDCGSNLATTSTGTSSTNNPKSSSDTQSS